MATRGARGFWVLGGREVRVHAFLLCAALWMSAAFTLLRPGMLDPFGRLKFPDFVHFYTLGDLARSGRFEQLYDVGAVHERQVARVPESAPLMYIPVYGPQTSLIFAPLAGLPYLVAASCWAALTALTYAVVVFAAWYPGRQWLPSGRFVAVAAAAFPPFWSLILHGQTTLVPLAAFALAWRALTKGRMFAAGLALGLLTVKPQFGVALALLTLVSGQWVVILGAAVSIALQAGMVGLVMGTEVLGVYAGTLRQLPTMVSQLEPRPYQLHSVRAWTQLLPESVGPVVFGLACLAIAWLASRAWRSGAPIDVRFGVVILSACLANPHFTVYDATVLALPLLWIGAWVQRERPTGLRTVFWPLTYGLFAFLLLPSALVVSLQFSVVLQGAIFWLCVRAVRSGQPEFRAAVCSPG